MAKTQKERYYLFLNPYLEYAFTRCPKCSILTKVRKFCLVIRIEPHHFISLYKSCRFCPNCELLIVKKLDLEDILCKTCKQKCPEIIGNDYFILGTMNLKDWKEGQQQSSYTSKILIEKLYPFKDSWHFNIESANGSILLKNKMKMSKLNKEKSLWIYFSSSKSS